MGAPRKIMVAVMVGVGSPKTTSIFPEAVATALSSGRNTVVGAWGASLVNPAPRATVTASRTRIVAMGWTVTSQLRASRTLDM